ncbi:MAG: hypothetical protein CMO80_03675 [Verrucomicrobiales bacterium]|nr:hypothetical protein [Verrucomicrobiales bacterium]
MKQNFAVDVHHPRWDTPDHPESMNPTESENETSSHGDQGQPASRRTIYMAVAIVVVVLIAQVVHLVGMFHNPRPGAGVESFGDWSAKDRRHSKSELAVYEDAPIRDSRDLRNR